MRDDAIVAPADFETLQSLPHRHPSDDRLRLGVRHLRTRLLIAGSIALASINRGDPNSGAVGASQSVGIGDAGDQT